MRMKLATLSISAFSLIPRTSADSPDGEDSSSGPSVIDPCATLCVLANGGPCYIVRDGEQYCKNLYLDENGSLVVTDSPADHLTVVSVDRAFNMVSGNGQTCAEICQKSEGCSDSFCKANNHCQGLFWETLDPAVFCYHSLSKPCRPDTPVHCNSLSPGSTLPSTTTTSTESTATMDSSSAMNQITTAVVTEEALPFTIKAANATNATSDGVENTKQFSDIRSSSECVFVTSILTTLMMAVSHSL